MTVLAGLVIGALMYLSERYDLMAGLAVLVVAFVLWLHVPAWRHPATGPAPADAAHVGPPVHDPDPLRHSLNRIDLMPPLKAVLMPIAVIAFVLGTAALLGLINHYWLNWW